jgi:hypothetical protein
MPVPPLQAAHGRSLGTATTFRGLRKAARWRQITCRTTWSGHRVGAAEAASRVSARRTRATCLVRSRAALPIAAIIHRAASIANAVATDQPARLIPWEDTPPERVCLVRQAESSRVETTPVSLARPMRAAAPIAVQEVMEIIRDMSRPHVPSGVGVPEDTAAVATEVATVAAAVVVTAVPEAVATAVVRAVVRRVVATAEAIPPAAGILAGSTGNYRIPPHLSNQQGGSSSLPKFLTSNPS